ncbi:ABC transporter ATP-binding protein/permease [Paenibacillus thiaminolyticus]|uniref:ABC transporter ATP-binding protein n=1 Tax=Paenibacillus thiaminolyticus TaxID=49283 RepID=A0AAP9IZ98_PANTH|nr:ABC transporter ATP-binding protein [Paenibacillus thiaminolyticus]MCY9537208.1 ABC transporter ATP-binding protein/permease [Paenibacillus thiaminolyticus]MCY9600625.1 ABC transporter ATP-binding protein/permease [Paenibacillus thiaminolyticus]MCY9608361.1 ABC transporter ATP-binding protein/permease [Paenibacillus thiaminolyticus]MCY9614770.1 ABC transporter ATP-binding protein/permease [Paenibacillus thiaminolyticus]MCY9619938.1 ABC transporter ATP-binding protein/permease [Paenibacillus
MKRLTLKQFIGILDKYRPSGWLLFIALVLSIIQTGISLIIPLVSMELVDLLVVEEFNIFTLLGLLLLFMFQVSLSGISLYMMIYIGEGIIVRLREDLWRRVVRFPVKFFDANNSGEIMSRITNDTMVMKNFFVEHLIPFFTGLITITGSLFILFLIDWKMALIFLLVFPAAFLVLNPLGKKMYRVSKDVQTETALFQGNLSRVLSDVRLVKLSVAENEEAVQGAKRARRLYKYGLESGKVIAVVSPLITTTLLIVLVGIFGYGGYQVATGSLSAGALVAIVFYIFQIMTPVTLMAQFFTQAQKAMGATERVNSLLVEELEEVVVSNKENVKEDIEAGITFSNVVFSYSEKGEVLNNISFTAKEGKKTAIVGESGVGKTTLFSLLERFYIVDSGDIFYNGRSIYSHELSEWREKIAYVSQDTPIMEGSIKDNLVYGIKKDISDSIIFDALKSADLDSFVSSLPQGLDTEVGEKGIRLSGGQKQRIAIARAIIRDPKILLLDEATAHLDSQSEALVQEAFNNLMRDRTTIIIAHRLSTIKDADCIVVIQEGKVSGCGSHYELYETNQLYKNLFNQQTFSKELVLSGNV